MNFKEEQEILKKTATEILLFCHKRNEAYKIRDLSVKMGVSDENAKKIFQLYDLLDIDNESMSKNLETLLGQCIKICENERNLKGNEIDEYF
ncbi:MAG: hypothetical protein LBE36_06545 [Flavobacteriaceae bacterium]|jgi:hypothetical protein|nr:hypothetical protein [Flavobacteriaceae bacterium]